jgi:hypothetical protein
MLYMRRFACCCGRVSFDHPITFLLLSSRSTYFLLPNSKALCKDAFYAIMSAFRSPVKIVHESVLSRNRNLAMSRAGPNGIMVVADMGWQTASKKNHAGL